MRNHSAQPVSPACPTTAGRQQPNLHADLPASTHLALPPRTRPDPLHLTCTFPPISLCSQCLIRSYRLRPSAHGIRLRAPAPADDNQGLLSHRTPRVPQRSLHMPSPASCSGVPRPQIPIYPNSLHPTTPPMQGPLRCPSVIMRCPTSLWLPISPHYSPSCSLKSTDPSHRTVQVKTSRTHSELSK